MRCCICASGYKAFTTNLRRGGTEHEKEMDLDGSAGDPGDAAVYRHWRRNSAALVELAAAAALRLAPDHLLASARDAGAMPHPLRRTWHSWHSWFQYAFQCSAAHGRAVGADDAGRTRKSPPALGTLRIRAARSQADGVSAGRVGLSTEP